MLIHYYKDQVVEVFAVLVLAAAGSATLLSTPDSESTGPGPKPFAGVEAINERAGVKPGPGLDTIRASEEGMLAISLMPIQGDHHGSCRIHTAWCDAEILLLSINQEDGKGRPSAPSPIP
jgi:hypothetical protein